MTVRYIRLGAGSHTSAVEDEFLALWSKAFSPEIPSCFSFGEIMLILQGSPMEGGLLVGAGPGTGRVLSLKDHFTSTSALLIPAVRTARWGLRPGARRRSWGCSWTPAPDSEANLTLFLGHLQLALPSVLRLAGVILSGVSPSPEQAAGADWEPENWDAIKAAV
ncbi:unnamed protein product [Lepidochelys kempii]